MSGAHPRLDTLHILAPGRFGGLERVVHDLAAAQRDAGLRVAVAAVVDPASPPDAFLERLRRSGIATHVVRVPARAYLRERRALRALATGLAPRVAHTHGYRADVIGGAAASGAGFPVVSTVHGFTGGGRRNRLYEALQARVLRRFDAVAAVAASVAANLRARGVPPERIHVVRNAWRPSGAPHSRADARAALGLPADAAVAGWVGRLSPEKGAELFLEAVARARHGVLASVVGDGPEAARLARLAARLGISARVAWHGALPDAAALFPAFDVFVLSSGTEGTPMVLLEAMACRVPIVATRVGGVPDVVGPGEARLVPPGDAVALARAIDDVLDHPGAAATRAAAAAARLATDFSPAAWVEGYEALYASARRDASRPARRQSGRRVVVDGMDLARGPGPRHGADASPVAPGARARQPAPAATEERP